MRARHLHVSCVRFLCARFPPRDTSIQLAGALYGPHSATSRVQEASRRKIAYFRALLTLAGFHLKLLLVAPFVWLLVKTAPRVAFPDGEEALDDRSVDDYTMPTSSILYFQRKMTGSALTSAK
jgi:hypothetical protein